MFAHTTIKPRSLPLETRQEFALNLQDVVDRNLEGRMVLLITATRGHLLVTRLPEGLYINLGVKDFVFYSLLSIILVVN